MSRSCTRSSHFSQPWVTRSENRSGVPTKRTSSTPTASVEPSPVTTAGGPLTVAPVANAPVQALAETTSGAAAQRHGPARDPFNLLPGTAIKL